jgi:hypothetical protein
MADSIPKTETPAPTEQKSRPILPAKHQIPRQPSYWLWILCLLGVDYFSTLSYQPSITFQAAGVLGPIATALVVAIMLLAVLPLYIYMAKHSPDGEGAAALLERLLHGWVGKTLILILLGFAATDFVMLKSISLADASEHLIHNTFVARDRPLRHVAEWGQDLCREWLGKWVVPYVSEQVVVSIVLGVLGFGFWFLLRKGFNRKAIAVAVPLVGLYLLLNAIVIGSGLFYLAGHPDQVADWLDQVQQHAVQHPRTSFLGTGWLWLAVLVLSLFQLPQLSLGFSGFELSMIVMPQVRGPHKHDPHDTHGRISNTRKLLFVAAGLMSLYLLGGVTVCTLLIPPEQFNDGGLAVNRSLAYLAHGSPLITGQPATSLNPVLGPIFGSLYDLSSILILCFAGTSVMTALGQLLPRILLRFGMELEWADRFGLLFMGFAGINMVVTFLFKADVGYQRGAYATGVVAMILTTALVALGHWRQCQVYRRRFYQLAWRFAPTAALFLLLTLIVILHSPSGLIISCFFIGTILASSVVSRALRTDELRTIGFDFIDERSHFLWNSLRLADFPVLVPHRPGRHGCQEKAKAIREEHQLDPQADIVFLEVEVDDPSNFYQRLMIEIFQEENLYVIKVTNCVSIAHAIAAIALEMSRDSKPPGLHFGGSELNLLAASWSYLAFGVGNIPWKVRELIVESESDPNRRPRVVVG